MRTRRANADGAPVEDPEADEGVTSTGPLGDDGPMTTAEDEAPAVAATGFLRRVRWSRLTVFVALPLMAMFLAGGAGYAKWRDVSVREGDTARIEASQVAHDSTIALLSYAPDDVEQKLGAARQLLTGQFQDSYTSLINDLVIPSAKQKRIASTATVPAVAAVSASATHVVTVAFVNQTVTMGDGAPTNTASSVRVTLDKVGGRWLVSSFEPV